MTQPAPFARSGPRIASNGDIFLVVWYDDLGAGIRAARLDREGRVIDPVSIPIANHSGLSVSVASDGRDFMIAYGCDRNDTPPRTCLARVLSENGAAIPGGVIENAASADIASNGRGYVVAFMSPVNLSLRDLYAIPVASDGSINGLRFKLAATVYPPAIASNGTNYLVVWSSYQTLNAILISDHATLAPVQKISDEIPGWGAAAFGWAVASNHDSFVIVWQKNIGVVSPRYVTELRSRVVSTDGIAGENHLVVSEPEYAWYPAVAWNGAQYVVAYTFSSGNLWPPYFPPTEADIHVLSLEAHGALLKSPSALAARPRSEMAATIASNGLTTIASWIRDERSGATEIEAKSVVASRDDPPSVVSNSITWQQNLAGSKFGSGALVAWEEITGENQRHQVFIQQLDSRGNPRGGRGVEVAESKRDQLRPAIAGSMIAWIEPDPTDFRTASLFARRIGGDGLPAGDAVRVGDASPAARVAVAAIESRHLIVWETAQQGIAFARFDDGNLIDWAPLVNSVSAHEWNPDVTTDGINFLVAWNRDVPPQGCVVEGCTPYTTIRAALVTASGIVGPVREVAAEEARDPRVLWDGSNFVVFWNGFDILQTQPYFGAPGFKARRIDPNGVAFDGPAQVIDTRHGYDVAWNGSDYLAAISSGNQLIVARLGPDLHLVESVPITGWLFGIPFILPNGILGYQSLTLFDVSRATVVLVGDASQMPARRRAAAH